MLVRSRKPKSDHPKAVDEEEGTRAERDPPELSAGAKSDCGNRVRKSFPNLIVLLVGTLSLWGLYQMRHRPKHHTLVILIRSGAKNSAHRLQSIKNTWASGLDDGQLHIMKSNEKCRQKYGDNHWEGLTCLEASTHTEIMNRMDFSWLLVVDDDTYVFAARLTKLLDTFDPRRLQVFGSPGCGNCGGGRKGLCGGGGYFLSRQSLLHMAGMSDGPVPANVSQAFIDHFMQEPDRVWADVRFACVAQDMGLLLLEQPGMYGNPMDEKEETEAILLKANGPEYQGHPVTPPLVFHRVNDATHMERIHHLAETVAF